MKLRIRNGTKIYFNRWFAVTIFGLLIASIAIWILSKPKSAIQSEVVQAAAEAQANIARVLAAHVDWTSTDFRVANQDSINWQRCKLEVNAAQFDTGYSVFVDQIKIGETLAIPHDSLQAKNGAVYNYSTNPPHRFTIRCQNADTRMGIFIGSVAQ
ncbi:hypothetical protein HYW32_02930 [Candidatus Berkelbacteria bacterium]|nr:hypothetical protein [Candidatus Berkelbacteria bacterium]